MEQVVQPKGGVKDQPDQHDSALLRALRREFRDPGAAAWREAFGKLTRKCHCPPATAPVPFERERERREDGCCRCSTCVHEHIGDTEWRQMPIVEAIPFLAEHAEKAIRDRMGQRNVVHEAAGWIEFSDDGLLRALALDRLPSQQRSRHLCRAVAQAVRELTAPTNSGRSPSSPRDRQPHRSE